MGGMPGFRPAPIHIIHLLPSVGAALFACNGLATGLLAREKTDRGRKVETGLPAGTLLHHPKVLADGNYIPFGCVHSGFIASGAKPMNIADYVAEPCFLQGRGCETSEDVQEMRDTLTRIMATRTSAE